MTGGRKRLHALFMAVSGLVGWLVVVAAIRDLTLPPVADLEAAALFLAVVAGALLYGWSHAFAVGPAAPASLWTTAGFGGAFLGSYYLVQAIQQWLGGAPWPAALRRNVYSVACEVTLLPLAVAIALIYEPERPVPFALLGGTYLLVNFGFKRLAELATDLRRRVA